MSKKSTASERTEKQLDVFIDPAPEAGPLKLRPFSAGTLTLCRKLGLTNGDVEALERVRAARPAEQMPFE